MTLEFVVIVPARRGSSRLPDKPMLDIGGIPMIARTLSQASKSGASRVLAAVDDEEIAEIVREWGYESCMTGECDSGTSRVAEASERCGLSDDTVVVNVQSDEPFIEPELVGAVGALAERDSECLCSTAMRRARDMKEFTDPSLVKVVTDVRGRASYFSRSPIPHSRDSKEDIELVRIHIGIYGYRVGSLKQLRLMPPSPLEELEKLEQLRILWHGYKIGVLEYGSLSEGVDTIEDLEKARKRASK